MLPTVANIVAKVTLEPIKVHLESLIGGDLVGFCFGSSCSDIRSTPFLTLWSSVQGFDFFHLFSMEAESLVSIIRMTYMT